MQYILLIVGFSSFWSRSYKENFPTNVNVYFLFCISYIKIAMNACCTFIYLKISEKPKLFSIFHPLKDEPLSHRTGTDQA